MIGPLAGQCPGHVLHRPLVILGDDHIEGACPGFKVCPGVPELCQSFFVDVDKSARRVHLIDGFGQQLRQFAKPLLIFPGRDRSGVRQRR